MSRERFPSLHGLPRKGPRSWITEASLIAIAPFYGYLLAYVYQLGFCRYFNVPIELVRVDVGYILAMSPIGVVCIPIIMLIVGAFDRNIHELDRRTLLGIVLISLALVVVPLVYMYSTPSYWFPFWAMTALCVILNRTWRKSLYFLVTGRVVPTVRRRRFRAAFRSRAEILGERRYLSEIIWIVIYAVAVLGISMYGGYSRARNNEEYLVSSEMSNMVLLRVYDRQGIFIPIDRKEKTAWPRYRIVELKEATVGELRWERVGPLEPMSSW